MINLQSNAKYLDLYVCMYECKIVKKKVKPFQNVLWFLDISLLKIVVLIPNLYICI